MIGYVMLGTQDLARGGKFYDAIAGELGAKRLMEDEQLIVWGKPGHKADFTLTYPWPTAPATKARRASGSRPFMPAISATSMATS